MRLLILLLALVLAVPASFAVAFPRALPSALEPLGIPAGGNAEGGDGDGHASHDTHGREHAHPEQKEDAHASDGGHASHAGTAGSATGGEHEHGRVRTAWPEAAGRIPASTADLTEVSRVHIRGTPNVAELVDLGVNVTGSGTLADPYVLEGLWVTSELELQDTASYYVIRNNIIDGTLRLNWNDDRVHVHHNDIRDLRVNENIERSGEATGGLIELNRFGVVGQIRHFDGIFRHNEVGPIPRDIFDAIIEDTGEVVPFFSEPRAVNIDGFDGAIFQENTILGYVEMQLHGHHHASCFDCHSHNHAVAGRGGHDHTIRYHEAEFVGNTITVEDGVAFRYTDAAHSGDDRTANSETNRDLEKPHEHFTRLVIASNVITGGPMVVDILNADSRDHRNEETEDEVEPVAVHGGHAYRADIVLQGNRVTYPLPEDPIVVPWLSESIRDALLVREVKEANVLIADNVLTLSGRPEPGALRGLPFVGELVANDGAAGLHLVDFRAAAVAVGGNDLAGGHFGILSEGFAEDAAWRDEGNRYEGVERETEER